MRKLLFIVLLLWSLLANAQSNCDTRFINHLVIKEDYREALFLLKNCGAESDSANYLTGWSYYAMKELEKSTFSFLKVSENSDFYMKSRFFAAYNSTYLHNYSDAQILLNDLKINREVLFDLRTFQLAGIDLLNGDYTSAKNKLEAFDATNPTLYQPVIDLKNITGEMEGHKSKSPVLAGIMSAIVPGSGKFYAGKKGEGIAAFISNVGFGLITWENYRKLGYRNAKTIFFGSLFAANYVSNIYGSVMTIKIAENDYQEVMQNQILFNMHIPLRNFFE